MYQQKSYTIDVHYVINLGRQLGSGGKEIGEKLANDLGIAFYDKELINCAGYGKFTVQLCLSIDI